MKKTFLAAQSSFCVLRDPDYGSGMCKCQGDQFNMSFDVTPLNMQSDKCCIIPPKPPATTTAPQGARPGTVAFFPPKSPKFCELKIKKAFRDFSSGDGAFAPKQGRFVVNPDRGLTLDNYNTLVEFSRQQDPKSRYGVVMVLLQNPVATTKKKKARLHANPDCLPLLNCLSSSYPVKGALNLRNVKGIMRIADEDLNTYDVNLIAISLRCYSPVFFNFLDFCTGGYEHPVSQPFRTLLGCIAGAVNASQVPTTFPFVAPANEIPSNDRDYMLSGCGL